MKQLHLLLLIMSLALFFPFTSYAQSEDLGTPCADKPLTSSSESRSLKKENPDCWELRTEYQTSGVSDALPLQTTDAPDASTMIASLQNILRLLLELQLQLRR